MSERLKGSVSTPAAQLAAGPVHASRADSVSAFSAAPAPKAAVEPASAPRAESSSAGYAGRTRYTLLEYEAALANAWIGIAFTRDRKFFLCNPKFAEIFGWAPNELIGQPGECVYPSRESYSALGAIAVPALSDGRQLDLE